MKRIYLLLLGLSLLLPNTMKSESIQNKYSISLFTTLNTQLSKKLPKQAQLFIRDYWPNVDIIEVERDNGMFKVTMDDGTILRFDRKGDWRAITNPFGFPTHYLPDGIGEFIHAQYPSSYIARVLHNNGYTVYLNSGLELRYDEGGHIQKVID